MTACGSSGAPSVTRPQKNRHRAGAAPHWGGALGGTGLGVGIYWGARRAWRGTDKLRHATPTRGLPSGEVLEHRFVNEGEQ